jgi:hypothetical protein
MTHSDRSAREAAGVIIWTGSWSSKHQPWLSTEPSVLALVLLVSCAVRATVDGRPWRRRCEQLRTDGSTDGQLSSGERVLRRGAAPSSPVEREAALHVAALALLVLAVAVARVDRGRLDRRCDELHTQVAVRP